MQKFTNEEYHMWEDFEFCITDEDIEKLKQGETLYGTVNSEFTVILKYFEVEPKESEGMRMTKQEKELLQAYKEKVEIQEEIIKSQEELIDKLEQLKELQEKQGIRIAYKKGYQQALEDIGEGK